MYACQHPASNGVEFGQNSSELPPNRPLSGKYGPHLCQVPKLHQAPHSHGGATHGHKKLRRRRSEEASPRQRRDRQAHPHLRTHAHIPRRTGGTPAPNPPWAPKPTSARTLSAHKRACTAKAQNPTHRSTTQHKRAGSRARGRASASERTPRPHTKKRKPGRASAHKRDKTQAAKAKHMIESHNAKGILRATFGQPELLR